ncbi:MAG: DoxX family protein [Deltaproteobacteria bacterium]|nr:MAG: DoxX family protein [Deltaproteobacteria bacterium]
MMLVAHGWGKLMGGPEKWEKLGGAMESLGITFAPTFWGFCAASAESVGAALVVVGLLTRPAAASVAFTLAIAAWMHLEGGDGLKGSSHAIETGLGFLALAIAGGGRLSVDAKLASDDA